jgi:hypothetical protein
MHLLTLPPGLSTIMIVQDRTRDSVSTSRCYCFAPVLPSHEDGDVALTSNKRRPSFVLRRHEVNDWCCRRRLASVSMAKYPNVQFVVSDGSEVGIGWVDFDNGADNLTVLGHWWRSLTSSLIVWAMPSVTVMRNVHHNNVMFIYQLVPME